MARSTRIVSYAVNGSGVGHLTRQMALMRWVRRYAACARADCEIWFLSSSEADGLLFSERFASFKLPSKTAVQQSGIDKAAYLALAKQWVWHSLGLLSPDLFVVDTFPRGAFGELLSALDLARARAFVYRPVKEEFAARPDFQAMLPLYDLLLVPDHAADAPVVVPAGVRHKLKHVAPVSVRDRAELQTRDEARRALGIPAHAFCLYATAGGGGDERAGAHLGAVSRAFADDPSVHLVVGAGPLYRGPRLTGPRTTWLVQGGAAELMPAFDLAISAAGYNTFWELMQAGVPTLFLPQPKVADDQELRARRAVAAGAGMLLASLEEASIRDAVSHCRQGEWLARAAQAAGAFAPRNGARDGAAALLSLVLPPAEVEAAVQAVDDAFLAAARRLGVELEDLLPVVDAVEPHREGGGTETARETSRLAVGLLDELGGAGVAPAAALKVLPLLGRKLARAGRDDRTRAMGAVARSLAPFDDWNGAQVLLQTLGTEKELGADAFAHALCGFLGGLHASGEDLFDGVAKLARARGDGLVPRTNAELLRAAGGEGA